jgi:quinol monooxygenase YgiN
MTAASLSSSGIRIIAVLKAKQGQEAVLHEALLQLIPLVRQEPGCIEYSLHVGLDQPGLLVFYETWADQAAIDRHGQTIHFLAFAARCETLLAEPMKVMLLSKVV